MEEIISQAANLGSIGTMIVLLFMMIERWISKGYLRLGKKGEKKDLTPPWALKLTQYFNHETTGSLEKLIDGQNEMCKKMDRMISKQEEMLKYGVPTKK